jgi:hypothetical protein
MHVGQNWDGVTIRQLGGEVDFFWAFVPPTVSQIKVLMSAFACTHSLTS